jgi:mRNA-degrading endonuclease RelE of RelBE toxin-antitoxin system
MFEIKPSIYFLDQIKSASDNDKKIIEQKLRLIKINPFRFDKLEGYKHVFKIRINFADQSNRLIYAAFYPMSQNVFVFGVFNRKKSYKDFKRIFSHDLKKLRKS